MEEEKKPMSPPPAGGEKPLVGTSSITGDRPPVGTPPAGGAKPPLGPPPQPNRNGKGSGTTLKVLVALLAIALLVSLGFLYSVWNQTQELTTENTQVLSDKDQVTKALEELKVEYGDLRTNNDTLNTRLNEERKKIDLLLAKIKKTDASNRSKIKGYEKEINNLRGMLKDYVQQIDSLSALNKELRAENSRVKQDADHTKRQVEQLSEQAGSLKSMVDKGSVVKARNLTATALSGRDKIVSKARQTEQIRACLTLIENSIAKSGPRTVYLRVKAPDGSLLTQSASNLFDAADGGPQLIFSGMREVEYNGQDLDVCIFYKDTEEYTSGSYSIEAYLDGVLVGTTQLVLK